MMLPILLERINEGNMITTLKRAYEWKHLVLIPGASEWLSCSSPNKVPRAADFDVGTRPALATIKHHWASHFHANRLATKAMAVPRYLPCDFQRKASLVISRCIYLWQKAKNQWFQARIRQGIFHNFPMAKSVLHVFLAHVLEAMDTCRSDWSDWSDWSDSISWLREMVPRCWTQTSCDAYNAYRSLWILSIFVGWVSAFGTGKDIQFMRMQKYLRIP